MGELLDLAGSILRQPNVWVAFALFCVGSMTQVSRFGQARGLAARPPVRRPGGRRLAEPGAGRHAGQGHPGAVRCDWRGCNAGWGLPIDSAEGLLNVLMLVPFGIAAGYALRRFWPVALAGLAASLLVEATQGLLGNGSCQGDDVVRNVAGVRGRRAAGRRLGRHLRPAQATPHGQVTLGFQSLNRPDELAFQAHTCSSKNGGMP